MSNATLPARQFAVTDCNGVTVTVTASTRREAVVRAAINRAMRDARFAEDPRAVAHWQVSEVNE